MRKPDLNDNSAQANQFNFDVKSPIQQELRLSKVANHDRAPASNYMLKEKGSITQTQQQQIKVV